MNNSWDKETWNKYADSFAKAFTFLFQRHENKVCGKETNASFAEVAAIVESQFAALPDKIQESAGEVHVCSQENETT